MAITPDSPNRAYMLVHIGQLLENADSVDAALAACGSAERPPAAVEDAGYYHSVAPFCI
jgi:hypothetical protein